MKQHHPVWRSMLFVPATNEKLVDSALRRAPDAFQIDLEDSVTVARKEEARHRIPEIAKTLSGRGIDVIVRINQSLRMALADIECSVVAEVDGLNLPKVPNGTYVTLLDQLVTELERERGLKAGGLVFIPMVETAEGLQNMAEIARASDRVVAITIGAEDLALDLGMEPEADGLLVPNLDLLVTARAAGILPIGYLGSVAQFKDQASFRQTVRRSKKLGFEGGFCVHPDQIDILNTEFAPSASEVDFASALVKAYDEAVKDGVGAMNFRGKMIDQPIYERAQSTLAKHAVISAKERAKAAFTVPAG